MHSLPNPSFNLLSSAGPGRGQVRLAAAGLLYNMALYTGREESFEMVQLVSGLAHRVHSSGPQTDPETGLRLLLALGKAVHNKPPAARLLHSLIAEAAQAGPSPPALRSPAAAGLRDMRAAVMEEVRRVVAAGE